MNMTGYTKLFGSIVHSTIWREKAHVRLVWITMLALSNRHGEVEASVPGLADAARVSVAECEEALAKFMSPDTYSRTKDNEGRRVEECDGGWLLLNHALYREKMSADEQREKNRERQRRHRERQRADVTPDVTQNNDVSQPVTESNGRHDKQKKSQSQSQKNPNMSEKAKPSSNGSQTFSAEIAEVWEHFVGLWRKKRGKGAEPKLSPERKAKIKARLSDGYGVDRLKRAADGMWGREHNLEHGYLDAELCYRSASKVEMYEGFATPQQSTNPMSQPRDFVSESRMPPPRKTP